MLTSDLYTGDQPTPRVETVFDSCPQKPIVQNVQKTQESIVQRNGVDIAADIKKMHVHYGFDKAVEKLRDEELLNFLRFRLRFLIEEVTEGLRGIDEKNPDEIVDSLIDLIVVATGTLDLFKIDFEKAWNTVLVANMSKTIGIKAGRPNIYGFPDLVKPVDFKTPDHKDNIGLLNRVF